jgi:hypothetical protein
MHILKPQSEVYSGLPIYQPKSRCKKGEHLQIQNFQKIQKFQKFQNFQKIKKF